MRCWKKCHVGGSERRAAEYVTQSVTARTTRQAATHLEWLLRDPSSTSFVRWTLAADLHLSERSQALVVERPLKYSVLAAVLAFLIRFFGIQSGRRTALFWGSAVSVIRLVPERNGRRFPFP